jgi:radical SAM family RiPP maturation amino acid epimerase
MVKTNQIFQTNSAIKLVFDNKENHSTKIEECGYSEIAYISNIKRFLERWIADPSFKRLVSVKPYEAINRYNLKVDLEEMKALWEGNISKQNGELTDVFTNFKQRLECNESAKAFKLVKSAAASSSNPYYKAWRERQIARTTSQFKKKMQTAIIHAPVCFELSKGCSIGCWFCGVSAPRLGDIFFYSRENAKLWREIQQLIKKILGSAASAGFCYWASDPFDNPDYEKFCLDFYEIFGFFPQTTTAQPLKDIVRTRSLLKLSREKGYPLNRFSILSLKMLNRVHEEFSAEELAFVDLVLQNPEADKTKANTGKIRERSLKKGETDNEFPDQGTIACVSGFLFNMVDRSVKLISPCNASERWPLGYIVYDEGTFSDAKELKILLEKMISDNMPLEVRPNDVINFRRDLKYENLDDGFQLSTKFKTFKFRHDSSVRELGEIIHKGGKTAEEIVSIFDSHGIASDWTLYYLNLMFEKGVLDEEPQLKDSKVLVHK